MAQLCPHEDELEKLDVTVLLITFSSAAYARRFKHEACDAFPLFINREQDLYRTYGLESSRTSGATSGRCWSASRA